MNRSSLFALAALGLVTPSLAACGDSALTCKLLADDDNCWAEVAEDVEDCLPDVSVGELSSDRQTCSFGDGSRVVFEEPLSEHAFDLTSIAFEIERGGVPCARFVDRGDNRMELTADGETAALRLHDDRSFTLRCPGGETYETTFDALIDCAGDGTPLPSAGLALEDGRATFSIGAVTTPGVIFVCE